jgi:hypothetical protein
MKPKLTVIKRFGTLALLLTLAACGAESGSDKGQQTAPTTATADLVADVNGYLTGPGTGADDAEGFPFSLKVRGLMNADHSTDVEIVVTSGDSRIPAPVRAQHILLKSFDSRGKLGWSQNARGVALIPSPDGRSSSAWLPFADLSRGQVIGAQVQIRSRGDDDDAGHDRGDGHDRRESRDASGEGEDHDEETLVLRAAGLVVLRPDIAVVSVTAPAQAAAGQAFTLTATLRELNGDLGADAVISASNNNTLLDSLSGVHVNAGATATVMLAATLQTEGTYTLQVSAGTVVPGDYDLSNNSGTVSIQIVGGAIPADSVIFYDRKVTQSSSSSSSTYGGKDTVSTVTTETARQSLTIPRPLAFPIDRVDVQFGADGTVKAAFTSANIALSSTSKSADGCSAYAYGGGRTSSSGNGGFQSVIVTVVSNTCTGASYTEVVAQQQASESVYTTTQWAVLFSSATTTTSRKNEGTVLNGSASVSFRTVVTDGHEIAGGTLDAPVVEAAPVVNSWDYWTAATSHEQGSSTTTRYTAQASGAVLP